MVKKRILLLWMLGALSQSKAQVDRSDQNYCLCEENTFKQSWQLDSASIRVLEIGKQMALITRTIVLGSCWDFVNEVFQRAGVSASKRTVFKSKKAGPYADSRLVQPGDWIYHVNHNSDNVEHSAIFVCWKDFEKRQAVTLSYAGRNRSVPARYGIYDLRSIYAVFRPRIPSISPVGPK